MITVFVIVITISDHTMIYCTRKILKAHQKYKADVQKEALEKMSIPNQETVRIKKSMRQWFGGEITEKIHTRDKLRMKTKMTKLHVDKDIYKET